MKTINFPQVREDVVSFGRRTRTYCPDHKAIVNPDNGKTFAIVSKNYKLVKHEQAIETVLSAVKEAPEFGKFTTDINIIDDGRKMTAELKFHETKFEIANGDFINPTINIRNSYDCSWKYVVMFGAFRLVCSNGLTIGQRFARYIKLHTQSLNQENVKRVLLKGMEEYSDQTKLWERWVDQVTTQNEYERVMTNIGLNKKETQLINDEVEISSDIMLDAIKTRTLSKWIFFNIIMQFITHRVKSVIKQASMRDRLRRLI